MRVFISHSSKDRATVNPFAEALRARGFDRFPDAWQIPTGQDFVAHINKGLDEAEASIIVFTADTDASPWVSAELSYLIYARVHEQRPLVPVVVDAGATIPPLLRMLVRRRIDEIDAIAEALRHRGTQRPAPPPEQGRVMPVVISLQRQVTPLFASMAICTATTRCQTCRRIWPTHRRRSSRAPGRLSPADGWIIEDLKRPIAAHGERGDGYTG